MDDEAVSGWHIDPSLRSAMRLDRARAALEQGDLSMAVIEAEELLDEEPEHVEGLEILADALLESGDAEGAAPVFAQILTLAPATASRLSGLAIARFDTCDLHGAREAAREAIRLDPGHAEAHFYLGLTLERLPDGKTEAVQCFAAAHQIDPAAYPFPLRVPPDDWERIVKRAVALLPRALQSFWDDLPIEIEDAPDLEELRAADPPLSPTVTGLYRGTRDEEDDPWEVRPEGVRLFARNLLRCHSVEELVEAVARTLEHEARDWLGPMDDEEAEP